MVGEGRDRDLRVHLETLEDLFARDLPPLQPVEGAEPLRGSPSPIRHPHPTPNTREILTQVETSRRRRGLWMSFFRRGRIHLKNPGALDWTAVCSEPCPHKKHRRA